MKKELKPLKSVDLLIIHCVGNRCDRPFSTESLINTGLARFGQVSYHWYIKRDGSIESLLPENVQGVLGNLNVIFSFCREIIGEKKNFCLVTNPRNKLIY